MALTASPTALTVTSAATDATFNINQVGYTGRYTAHSSAPTHAMVYAKAPISGAGTGASKETFGPSGDFNVIWVAAGNATITVTDDAGNTATCTITTS